MTLERHQHSERAWAVWSPGTEGKCWRVKWLEVPAVIRLERPRASLLQDFSSLPQPQEGRVKPSHLGIRPEVLQFLRALSSQRRTEEQGPCYWCYNPHLRSLTKSSDWFLPQGTGRDALLRVYPYYEQKNPSYGFIPSNCTT